MIDPQAMLEDDLREEIEIPFDIIFFFPEKGFKELFLGTICDFHAINR